MKKISQILFFTALLAIASCSILAAGCGVAKDTQIQIRVKNALREDMHIAHDNLIVNVKDGVVTISGELGSQADIERITEVVSVIEGVLELQNNVVLPDDWHSTNPSFNDYGLI